MIKKNKRKIKVPAASFGLSATNNFSQMLLSPQSLNMQYLGSLLNNTYLNPNALFMQQIAPGNQQILLFANQSYNNNANNLFAIDMLNRDPQGATNFINSLNNSPAALSINLMTDQMQTDSYSKKSGGASGAFANMDVGSLAAATTGGIASIAGYGPKSEATTRDEAVTQSLSDVSMGISTGAQMGSAFGPMGTVIGAGVGLGIGLIGRLGREAEMTSFTDYDEGTLGTGLIGAFKNKSLRRERERIKKNAIANRNAVRGTEQLRSKYAEQMSDIDTNVFAYGGTTNSLAYVDDGELISTPDGTVSKVPELGRPTDSNLVSLPLGSKVLSDKLKVPGTNKTFAKVAEEMMSTKKSKYKDIYAQNAAKLNDMNNKTIHDLLFEMLETLKAKKGIKRKYKDAVVAAENGIVIPYTEEPSYSKRYLLRKDGSLNFTSRPDEIVNVGDTVMYKGVPYVINSKYTHGNSNNALWLATPQLQVIDIYMPPVNSTKSEQVIKPLQRRRTSASTNNPAISSKEVTELVQMPELTMAGLNPSNTESSLDTGTYSTPIIRTYTTNTNSTKEPERSNSDINWGSIVTDVASLAPIISNLNTRPEYQDAIYNPYSSIIADTMRRRRYDISPAIRDMERNRVINNYNASQLNTNTGADLAFRLLNAYNTNKAIADIRAQESNINNAYMAEYANTLNNLGRQWADEGIRVQEANMANRAQARNIRRAGLSGLSQWFLNKELMRNQRNRDNMMMALYDPFLEAGFSTSDLNKFRLWLRRTNG